jgi:hypothetical protein
MKLAAAEFLGFSDLAKAWASEPGNRSYDYILTQLLAAYWSGAFEQLLNQMPEHWPQYRTTIQVLRNCSGFPPVLIEDGGDQNWEELSRVALSNYPNPGQAAMGAVELPRDMIRLWCLDQGYDLPRFWFPTDEDTRAVGRPSIAHRLIGQMTLHSERGELEPTIAAEARTLHKWATINLGHVGPIPKTGSIENAIRESYHHLKRENKTD